jgi:hypothetical protein
MPDPISPLPDRTPATPALALEEFRVLRATIGSRGTMRVVVALITFVAWAAILLSDAFAEHPLLFFVPLVVLFAGFEGVFGLHVSAERIGRFIRLYYETTVDVPKWETAIGAFGRMRASRGSGLDPLYVGPFGAATVLNAAFALGRISQASGNAQFGPEFWGVAVIHVAFAARLVAATRYAARQRMADAGAFETIRAGRVA